MPAQSGRRSAPPLSHEHRTWRHGHEGHELVGKSRHGAANADSCQRSGSRRLHWIHLPFGDITLDHGAPAAKRDDALGRAILVGEVRLLIVPAAVATFVERGLKEPRGSELLIEGDHRSGTGHLS